MRNVVEDVGEGDSMSGFTIDLNLYGPLYNIGQIINEARSTEESGLVYIATQKGKNPNGCDVTYIGINQQKDKGARYPNHHKLVLHNKASKFNELWVGYLYRLNEPFKGTHSERLKATEDILISWFLPPYNTQGISRVGGAPIGTGAYASGTIYFHWWTMSEKPRKRPGISGFPSSIRYSRDRTADDKFDWMTADY